MAREKEQTQEVLEEAPKKPKGKLKKIILLLVVFIVLLGGGAFAYILLFDEPAPPNTKKAVSHAERAIMPLEPFLVNLADKDSRRYLKVKIDLEVENEKAVKVLEKSMPRIRDQLIFLLSSKSYQDISTPEGKYQLKKDIMARLAALPTGKKITGAFFTEFVAQ
ncbi:MAG: flagellar basal body-associated FliL family protein [Syntrophales bacterium]|nr:flagellar basal body-associated FliL family protein [Syntrophales bacterium]MDD5641055.1 flagellar basal body-associated FliL family protein [Syntrophales bacterium]